MKHYSSVFAFLAAAALLIGCVEEHGTNNMPENGKEGGFAVGGVSKFETKAGAGTGRRIQTNRIALSEPGDPYQVFLVETVEDMDDTFYQSGLETKGTPVYTENFKSLNPYGFSAVPYYNDGGYKQYTTVEDNWCSPEGNYYKFGFHGKWTAEDPDEMVFFMSAPSVITETASTEYGYSNLTLTPADGKIAFDYACPDSTDATKQLDLLFTSKKVTRQQYAEIPTLLFYHTMAGVKFKSGNAVRELDAEQTGREPGLITSISAIKMTNILSSGHCVVSPDWAYSDSDDNVPGGKGDVDKSSKASVWSEKGNPTTFSVSGLSLVNTDTSLFPESTDFEGADISTNTDKQLGQLNLNSSNYNKTFMVVPQKVGEANKDVILTIDYSITHTINGVPSTKKYRKSVKFNDGNRQWEAGKLYTYTIQANHVAVTVKDAVNTDTNTKSNIQIRNTGNIDEYMRVAVVGNWYDSHSYYEKGQDQIVCPWGGFDATTEGTLEGPGWGESTDSWVDGGDGYFYFKYKVPAGELVSVPLFVSYKAGKCPMELYGDSAHLQMDIMVQAFDANRKSDMAQYGWKTDNYVDSYFPNN